MLSHIPTDGQIKLDGNDIRHLSANELRHYFGVVPQEPVLFSGTIYDNLLMANPHATFEQAKHFAATTNRLRGKVTTLSITHALPKNLLVDGVVRIEGGSVGATPMANGATSQ